MGKAFLSTNYFLNKIAQKKWNKTPYELWKDWAPTYKFLKVLVESANITILVPKWTKIGPKKNKLYIIDYVHNSCAYCFLVYTSNNLEVQINTIIKCKNVKFLKSIFPNKLLP